MKIMKKSKKIIGGMLSATLSATILLTGVAVNAEALSADNAEAVPYDASGNYDVSIPHIIINQVYGGGNNKGGASNGFIELYNPTDKDVNLDNWSLQYKGSEDSEDENWYKLDLSGIIPAHCSFLVRGKSYKETTTPHNYYVDNYDMKWDVKIHSKGVTVVLMSNQNTITDANDIFDNTTKKPIVEGYVDMIGVNGNDCIATEAAVAYEGKVSDSQSSKKAVRRIAFRDTDNNAVDEDDSDLEIIEYNATDEAYIEWAAPRCTADGVWYASEKPLYTETTELSSTEINTLTNSIGEDASTTRTFTWQMPSSVTDGKVTVSVSEDLSNAIEVSAECNAQNNADYTKETANVFRAYVNGLTSGTTYYYQVTSGDAKSPIYSFKTENKGGEFTFVHASDSQSKAESGYSVYQQALEPIVEKYNPAFVLESGDLVDTNYFEDEWRWFVGYNQKVLVTLPFFPVVGNHEQSTSYPAYALRDHFTVPNECTDENVTPGTVYSFDYGQAHFVILNSECKGEGLEAQRAWADKDMSETKQKFIIVSMHRGMYGGAGIAEDIKGAFGELFDKHKVDLVLFGHDHLYIRSKALINGEENENGTIQLEAGGCASKQDSAKDLPSYAEITATPGKPVYNIISVTDEKISVQTVTVDIENGSISPLEDSGTDIQKSNNDVKFDFEITAKVRETSEPETSEPETSEPETSKPETSEPETSEPETSEPETSEPETSEPDTSKPETSKPDTSDNTDISDGNTTELPQTGDSSSLVAVFMLAISAGAVVFVMNKKKKA